VKTDFNPDQVSVSQLMDYLFEIIDPYALNKQGDDVGEKYRTGVYSLDVNHLREARAYIDERPDASKIMVEVKPLNNYLRSAEEHQDRLSRCPEDYCHISQDLLNKYK